MSEWKRTQFYDTHVAAGATMVEFGGWEMPVQYPSGIVAEHLYTRHFCSLFDVSHMGRILVEGPQRVEFLQHVLTSNVCALDLNRAQYSMISDENGFAVDDAYLYRFEEERFLLVVNAGNTDKDWAHLCAVAKDYDCTLTNITADWAAIAVQGPKSKELLTELAGGQSVTGGDLRIRGERVQSSGATGRENHTIACQRTLLASGRVKQANTANDTGNASRSRLASRGGVRINRFSDQIHDERVLDDMDVRRVACDGTDIKLDNLAGRVPARVHDAAAAVRGFQSAQQRAVRVLVEAHAGADEPAHLFGAFAGENIHGLRFA